MTDYIGRFAPSPTGPLHFGSLLAALASYLDARHCHGQWLVRIEDLDPPREDPTAASEILRILDAYGLHWDGDIVYQSQRGELYQAALDKLRDQGDAFPCACSRKQLGGELHLGVCPAPADHDFAWRFLCPGGVTTLHDGLQPDHRYDLADEIGDFVIRRRDGFWSYQLAVVVDDAAQEITHVVRGIDLIDSTVRQYLLQQALSLSVPQYSHIPVAVEQNGQKLSKQNLALPLSDQRINETLWQALNWLRQSPPQTLLGAPADELLNWAVSHWNPAPLKGEQSMPAPGPFQRT
ncbi:MULTISPECIES: tRNA glutamyl-Q(34) synthetase GluQRS [Thalassolituus]|uniref:tRNA glutamyl-Q(34) synthetase GluQRS n=1 Tax=Thalassolituus TaxID=187492 RepID=UPI000C5CFEEE|nr:MULTISPECIES: tRNA glutamyl-Q(34) synthetase GluQRS [Thalassolituus]MAX85661.1 tRNA glutamyl-Q(34) synthetase GluQRS [Oceanospirillaceae bacterium]MEC9410659.1 tRNA glutamyl-Q(34) synthetase GluQRS [Pseudomonadota bacterium]MEE3159569.1 tRNA glutamyl-Q(34) synthetase GluQRS [Pseudomonadota bacterium]|tara:strand:- start:15516 stop:16394 length:879 start_codon:yes stop_codon:yes gene_type:complete